MTALSEDVVLTGIGCATPFGSGRELFWSRLLSGASAVRDLNPSDFHGLSPEGCRFPLVGAPAAAGDERGACDPVWSLIDFAADEAFTHAGLSRGDFDPDRAGCVIGSSKGGIVSFARAMLAAPCESDRHWNGFPPNVGAASIARRFGLRGASLAPVAACSTGLVSVLRGADLIRQGVLDFVLAGSGDAALHPAVLASFHRMRVLAGGSRLPAACRPFNRDRDGFVVGEGAAVFVLERRAHADARRARPLATILGGALLSDPAGLTAVDPAGPSLARAIDDALTRAEFEPSQIGHVNLHGTATRDNDLAEAAALRAVFGPRCDALRCSAAKGAIGHLLGAAGAVELAATVLALRDGLAPPTPNFTDADPACRLPLARTAAEFRGCALKISLGFGGHVAVACVGPP